MKNEASNPGSRIDHWFTKPYRPGGMVLIAILIISAYTCFAWANAGMDNDSYYMIAQGREILESGIPTHNNFTFMDDKIVVQQWLYCIGMALANQIPGNWGLMAFMLIQVLILVILLNRMIHQAIKDPFWTWLATAIVLVCIHQSYVASLRPENITLILMLLQIMSLEKYRDTGRKTWLIALPIIMLAEANLHISMWPIHVCVYLAYLVPPVIPWLEQKFDLHGKLKFQISDHIQPDGLYPNSWLYGFTILSILAVFANPYGFDGVMYLFRSMPVFSLIGISEQEGVYLLSRDTIVNAAIFLLIAYFIKTKKIRATETLMIVGLTLLACTNYHNTMYMPIAVTMLARVILRCLAEKNPSMAKDIMPNGVKSVMYAGLAIAIMGTCALTIPKLEIFEAKQGMDPAIKYLIENQQPGENIYNNMNAGPMLEYYGLKNIYGDTRPELMLPAFTGCEENFAIYAPWFSNGTTSSQTEELYNNDIGEYLDKNNIVYILDTTPTPLRSYLIGWISNSDNWERIEFDVPDKIITADKRVYVVWQRTDRSNQN